MDILMLLLTEECMCSQCRVATGVSEVLGVLCGKGYVCIVPTDYGTRLASASLQDAEDVYPKPQKAIDY